MRYPSRSSLTLWQDITLRPFTLSNKCNRKIDTLDSSHTSLEVPFVRSNCAGQHVWLEPTLSKLGPIYTEHAKVLVDTPVHHGRLVPLKLSDRFKVLESLGEGPLNIAGSARVRHGPLGGTLPPSCVIQESLGISLDAIILQGLDGYHRREFEPVGLARIARVESTANLLLNRGDPLLTFRRQILRERARHARGELTDLSSYSNASRMLGGTDGDLLGPEACRVYEQLLTQSDVNLVCTPR